MHGRERWQTGALSNAKLLKLPVKRDGAEIGLGGWSGPGLLLPLLPLLEQLGGEHRGKQRLVGQTHLLQQAALINASNEIKTPQKNTAKRKLSTLELTEMLKRHNLRGAGREKDEAPLY